MHRKNKQTKAILKNEDNTSGEEKDDSDGDGSSVDDNNDNNDENPSDIVDSVDEPTDDKPESLAPIESIPSLSPSDPFKTELIDATNNNESGGSSNGGSTSDANNNNNNNSSSMLTNNSDVITSATNNNSKSKLDLWVDVKEDPIVRGNIQTIQVTLSDDESGDGIDDANVEASVEYASGEHTEELGSKTTDSLGHASFSWKIGGNSYPGTFTAIVQASKNGYDSETKRISFEVIPKGSGNGGNGDDYDEGKGNRVSTEQQSQNKKYFAEYTDNSPNSPVYITGTIMHKTALNDIQIDGEVKNNGTHTVDFVQVVTTFYDANNMTLGNDITYSNPSTLQPGQSAPFSIFTGQHIPIENIKSAKYHLEWE